MTDAYPMNTLANGIYFIDGNLDDVSVLVSGLPAGATYYILDPTKDGIIQMADILSGYSNLAAIHILSHGSQASLNLGSTVLNQASLEIYSSQLSTIGSALSETGDLLLYGCNVAQGETGQAFIEQLASVTGTDVAASNDLTGSTLLGGDWQLEETTGTIDVAELTENPGYKYTLAGAELVLAAGDNHIEGLLTGTKWASTSWTYLVTYSFPDSFSDYGPSYPFSGVTTDSFQAFNPDQQRVARVWLDAYQNVSKLNLTELPFANDSNATIRIAISDSLVRPQANFPSSYDDGGDVWLKSIGSNPIMGGQYYTYIGHELGHALGLKDTHLPTDWNGVTLNTDHDSSEFSIMSYRGYVGDSTTTAWWDIINDSSEVNHPQSLMMYDIAAIQYLYGANFDFNSDNTTYTFSTENGEMSVNGITQGVPSSNVIFRTIWDGNGNDTYDFSNYTTNLSIDLRPGYRSDLDVVGNAQSAYLGDEHYAQGQVFNALQFNNDPRSLIEDAVGGSGNDTINGNDANNNLWGGVGNDRILGEGGNDTIYGGDNNDTLFGDDDIICLNNDGDDYLYGEGGNDTLYGGGGNDTAVYSGLESEYTVLYSSGGDGEYCTVTDSIAGRDGIDTLYSIENIHFTGIAANTTPTFLVSAGDGEVTTDINLNDSGYSVTVQNDGKILVAGRSGSDFSLVRYNANGSLDTSFDGDGKVMTNIKGNNIGYSVTVQADGKILVAGVSNTVAPDLALVRYNTNGSLDTSFDVDGKVSTDFGGHADYGYSVTVQADGKILVAGTSYIDSGNDFALARYKTDGSLDTSFDSDGKVTTNFIVEDYGRSVTVQADGKILVAGYSKGDSGGSPYYHFSLARYNVDGSLDTSFDGDGKTTTDFGAGYSDYGRSVTVQADGKILVAGERGYNFALARYNTDGSLDTSFDDDGKVTTDFGGYDGGQSVTVQADGKILVVGSTTNGFALARYNVNGSLDTSFDSDGKVTTSTPQQLGYNVTVQADGKILVAGTSSNDFALARYNTDGSLDTTFDSVSRLNNTPTYTENGAPVLLDPSASIYDQELAALNSGSGNYNGASVTFARHGGASVQDVFTASYPLSFAYGNAILAGTTVGTVSNNAGTLTITFNANATQTVVNQVLSSIAYANTSNAPPTSVQIDWTFNDGNTSVQGTGGALSGTGSTTVQILADTTAPVVSSFSPTDGATDVAITADIIVTFNEAIQLGYSGSIDLKDGTGNLIESFDVDSSDNLTISGNALIINPTSDLASGTAYNVQLAPGSIKDLAGNSYAGTLSYDFVTDAPKATVTLTAGGSVSTDETTDLTLPMTASGAAVNISMLPGADALGASQDVSLVIDNAASGLTTTDNHAITLVADGSNNNLVHGQYTDGSGTHDAFTVSISDTGVLSVTQLVSLHHPDSTLPNEAVTLAGLLSVKATVVDGDGDVSSSSQAIGNLISFYDDGPSLGAFDPWTLPLQNGTVTGEFVLASGADGLDHFNVTGPSIAGVSYTTTTLADGTTTLHGMPTAGGADIFSLTVRPDGTYTYAIVTADAAIKETFAMTDLPSGTLNWTETTGGRVEFSSTGGAINFTSTGFGVGDAYVGAGESFTVEFHNPGASGDNLSSDNLQLVDKVSLNVNSLNGAGGTYVWTAANTITGATQIGIISINHVGAYSIAPTISFNTLEITGGASVAGQGAQFSGIEKYTYIMPTEQYLQFHIAAMDKDGDLSATQVLDIHQVAIHLIPGGSSGEFNLTGFAGDAKDWIAGSTIVDHIDGKGGFDVVDYTDSAAAVSIHLDDSGHAAGAPIDFQAPLSGQIGGGDSTGDTLSNIEGIIGGHGNDVLIGNASANYLSGGAGNDTMIGGSGQDTAVYSGTKSQYTLIKNNNGSWTIADSVGGRDGIDTLTGVEYLRFSDQTVTLQLPTNDAPTGSVIITGDTTQGQTLTASNTLADADGLGAISYQWTADGTPISGATANTFVLTEAQVGTTITVIASYTDLNGTAESVASNATSAVQILADTTAPTVTSFSPADGGTGVTVGSDILVTFNEAIQQGAGNIVLKTAAGTVVETYNAASSGNLSIVGNTLTVNPSDDLASSTGYTVEFAAGTIKDLAGNSYAGISSYDFTTKANLFDYLARAASVVATGVTTAANWTMDQIISVLTDKYDNGTKYLAYFTTPSLDISDAFLLGTTNIGPNVAVTAMFDIADIVGITTEGRGGYASNPYGQVTTWINAEGSMFSFGGGYSPIGIIEIEDIDSYQADPTQAFDLSMASVNWSGITMSTDGALTNVSMPTSAGLNLLDFSVNVGRFEADYQSIYVALANVFSQNSPSLVDRIFQSFSDITAAFRWFTPVDGIAGTDANDTLYGTIGNDVIYGFGGEDDLHGGIGSDTYKYRRDEGADRIFESGSNSSNDALEIWDNSSLVDLDNFNDLRFMRSGNNLVISLDIQGWFGTSDYDSGQVTIIDQGITSSAVEWLRIYDDDGQLVKGKVDLKSVWLAAGTSLSTLNFTGNANNGYHAQILRKVADGYLAGAAIFIDANGNGIADPVESTGVFTDSLGNFLLDATMQGPILAVGGTNIDTGLINTMLLSAPTGSTVINPMTTLVQSLVNTQGVTTEQAQANVAQAFGLSAGIDLLNYDPLAQNSGDQQALAVQKVNVQLAVIATLAGNTTSVINAIAQSVTDAVVQVGSTVDLSNSQTLSQITSGLSLSADMQTAIAEGNAQAQLATSLEAVAQVQKSTILSAAPEGTDWSAPTVISFSPADETTGVVIDSNIVVTFSEAIQRGLGSIVLKTVAGDSVETFDAATSSSLSISGSTLTIDPTSTLVNGTTYFATFAPGTIKDLVGNSYVGTTTYDFTTLPINSLSTGSVTIIGDATQGQTLTADVSTLADMDGIGTISYQWQANGIAIDDATSSTFVLNEDHVNETITVVASYTDGHGTAESMTSIATTAVANVNDLSTGSVSITGTATQGQTLTAGNTLADADGLGTISYQWKADGTAIGGATANTLVLTEAQVGKAISVVASYTDGHGTAESMTSSATSLVSNINDAPSGDVTITGDATQGQTLTVSNTLADTDGLGTINYQWTADGAAISGATASTFVLTEAQVGKAISVVASYTDGHGTNESMTSSATSAVVNVNDLPTGNVTLTGTAAQNQTLTVANTLADADGLGEISYQWKADGASISGATTNTFVLTEAQVGQAISVAASYTDGHDTNESVASSATTAVANINDAPTGIVTITGTAIQGQTLTAGNNLADADGLGGTISYQWKADGTAISGATANTFVLTEAQVGKAITVTASYTDGHDTAESMTSNATSAIANINDAPTGNVTITGTATQGQTLTAGDTLADADGLGTISYQWKADGTAIGGATSNTFVLTEAQVGKTISVVAIYNDSHGTNESVASTATSAVANINDLPTGNVNITGITTQGQTLTADINTLADTDGLGTISYQWKADGIAIDGETSSTLVLTEDQVNKTITVVACYTDGYGSPEAVNSAPTVAVTNINDLLTGSVTISGTTTQWQTLTAANTLADADGRGTINYQWQANGANISSATYSTFLLTGAQVGKTISVTVSYTDGHGTTEAMTSNPTSLVASTTALVTVTDSAANILANLAALQTLATSGKLTSISLTDAGSPTLALTAAQLTANATALGKIATTYGVSITDTATNITNSLATLQTLAVRYSTKLLSENIYATNAGTYDLTTRILPGTVNLFGSSGNDILGASIGSNCTLTGNGGYDAYKVGLKAGEQITINNNASDGVTTARGEVDFLTGLSTNKLWFQQNGNDLKISVLGTTETISMSGWYGSDARAQVQSFNTIDGNKLDSQLSQLVSAMAGYAASHAGFNPATTTLMPTDTSLQTAIAVSWHK